LWLAGCAALAFLTISLPAQAIVIRTAAQEGTEPKFIAGGGDASSACASTCSAPSNS
jgi:hypothetical protein